MSDYTLAIKYSIFVVLFAGVLSMMPTEIMAGVDPIEYHIPSGIDTWILHSNQTAINNTISQGSTVQYAFSETTAQHHLLVSWDTWISGDELIRVRKAVDPTYGLWTEWYEPDVSLDRVQGSWDSSVNASKIKLNNQQGTVVMVLEDINGTRNNITASWVANSLNCTMIYSTESYETDIWQSKEIVFSLLSFKLPQILTNIDPGLALLLSVMLYIPGAYLILIISIKILRG